MGVSSAHTGSGVRGDRSEQRSDPLSNWIKLPAAILSSSILIQSFSFTGALLAAVSDRTPNFYHELWFLVFVTVCLRREILLLS